MASSKVKLTTEEIQYITFFEGLTGAVAKDCIIDENADRIIFVVKTGDLGLAIGKRGANVKKIRKLLGKPVDIVEYADTPEELIKNALLPAKVKSVHITERRDGKRIAIVAVDPKDRGIAIGKNGKNVAKARILVQRHFNIDDVIIS